MLRSKYLGFHIGQIAHDSASEVTYNWTLSKNEEATSKVKPTWI